MRAFVRCLYEQHKFWAGSHSAGNTWRDERRMVPLGSHPLQVDVGRALPVLGRIPAGRAIRVRVLAGGQAKERALARMPDDRRAYDQAGAVAGRHSDPALRDWS